MDVELGSSPFPGLEPLLLFESNNGGTPSISHGRMTLFTVIVDLQSLQQQWKMQLALDRFSVSGPLDMVVSDVTLSWHNDGHKKWTVMDGLIHIPQVSDLKLPITLVPDEMNVRCQVQANGLSGTIFDLLRAPSLFGSSPAIESGLQTLFPHFTGVPDGDVVTFAICPAQVAGALKLDSLGMIRRRSCGRILVDVVCETQSSATTTKVTVNVNDDRVPRNDADQYARSPLLREFLQLINFTDEAVAASLPPLILDEIHSRYSGITVIMAVDHAANAYRLERLDVSSTVGNADDVFVLSIAPVVESERVQHDTVAGAEVSPLRTIMAFRHRHLLRLIPDVQTAIEGKMLEPLCCLVYLKWPSSPPAPPSKRRHQHRKLFLSSLNGRTHSN